MPPKFSPTASSAAERNRHWFTFVIAALILFAYGNHCIVSLLDTGDDPYRVLGSFWVSGWAANHGLNPYGFYPLTWHFHMVAHKTGPLVYDVNLSPPWMLPLFQLFAVVPIQTCVVAWSCVSYVFILAGAAVLLLRRPLQKRQIFWLLVSSATMDTLWVGQDYSLMFLFACCAWFSMKADKLTLATVAIGVLVAMKPNFGIWPVLLWAAGYRRAGIISLGVAAALFGSALLIHGPSVYVHWLQAYAAVPHFMFPSDISLAGVFTRLGSRLTGNIVDILIAATLLIYAWKTRPSMVRISGIGVCLGILCAPLAWYNYIVFLAPFFVGEDWGWAGSIAAFMLALPTLFDRPLLGNLPLQVFAVALPHVIGLCIALCLFIRPESHRTITQQEPESPALQAV